MNLLLVEILTTLLSSISPNLDNNLALSIINEMKQLGDNIDKYQTDSVDKFSTKIMEMKREYLQDLQLILNNNNVVSIKPLLNDYVNVLQDKTRIMLDDKISSVTSSIFDIKSINKSTLENQNILDNKVTDILNKFSSSNKKGNMAEMVTYNILRSLYGEHQLKVVNTTKETGDILLIRNDKPIIMIENKDYTYSVPQLEVDKFIRDLNVQKYSGIMISQNSEITNKRNFEISFYGQNIGIYLSNAKYDTDIIQIAIDTIDAIKLKIKDKDVDIESSSDTQDDEDDETQEFLVSRSELDMINTDFNIFVNQKLKHIKSIKESSKKLITETEQFNIPSLLNILLENYGSNKVTEWKCRYCDEICKNKGGRSSHEKKHINAMAKEERAKKISEITGEVPKEEETVAPKSKKK